MTEDRSRTTQGTTPAQPEPVPPPRRHGILLVLAALALASVVALLATLSTGALAPGTLVPTSALVTWGTPIVRALHHGALLGTVGAAWIVVLLLPPAHREDGTRLRGARARLARLAGACAAVWAGASLTLMLLGADEAAGSGSGTDLLAVALSTELGRIQLGVAIAAGLAALLLLLARLTTIAAWGLAAAMVGMLLLGFAGHAGASIDHTNAVNAMALHLAGMAIWGGPLLVMLCCPRLIGEAMPVVVRRFSPWALAGVVALAVSGLINASIRLDGIGELVTTPYGRLVALKAVGLTVIAVLGAGQRRRLGDRLRFRHLALTETVLLAAVVGLSIGLSRSAPPVPQTVPAVGELRILALVGHLPPARPFGLTTLFTQFEPDWVATAIAAALAGLYLAGVVRLTRRGDRWSLARTIPFVLGCAALWWVTSGGAAAWGRFRFDAHMVQHMALMMIVPPLWVLGAPVTLLSRALTPRTDGSRGVREWVLAALHSRYSRVVSFPPVAGAIFAGSLVVFYFTPLFELAMREHAGHVLMTVHFLLAGYLFAWVLIGVDPAPRPLNPALKLVMLLITLSFHAFFGVAVVSATWILGAGWFEQLGMYGPEQLELIQRRGGSIMWGVSEIPTLFYAIILAVMWTRSDDRLARQYDRKAARDGDADLVAYNAYLRALRGEQGAPDDRDPVRAGADGDPSPEPVDDDEDRSSHHEDQGPRSADGGPTASHDDGLAPKA